MTVPRLAAMHDYVDYHARRTPARMACIWREGWLSYAELEEAINACAALLKREGIGPGERVAVLAAAGPVYLIALMAVSRLGAIYVGVNPKNTIREIAGLIEDTDPAAFLVETDTADQTRTDRIRRAGFLAPVVELGGPEDLPDTEEVRETHPVASDDIAVIVFTSGSTGRAKGAALHHGGLIEAAIGQYAHLDARTDRAARYLSNLPINHVGGVMNLTLGALVGGGSLVFRDRFDPLETLRVLETEEVTTWLQVPAMFTLVANHPEFDRTDFSALRTICIGGGPVSAPTLARLRSTSAEVFVEYGQTEVMSSLSYSDFNAPDEVLLNTIGRFDPRFETRIVGPDNQACPVDIVGEIQARGNCTLRRYWGNEEATAAAFTSDGWLKTGDLALQRPDGNIVLKGRNSEMIKSAGYNVYPREVEQILETHPKVAEVVVFGIPDAVYSERVVAAIELRDIEDRPTEADLVAWCRTQLARYKLPRAFLMSESLPRLPNGKLDRPAVRRLGERIEQTA